MDQPAEHEIPAGVQSVISFYEEQLTRIDEIVDRHLRTAIETKSGRSYDVMYAVPQNRQEIDQLRADLREVYEAMCTEQIDKLRSLGCCKDARTRSRIDERIETYERELENLDESTEAEFRQIIVDEFGFTYDEVRAVPGNATIIDALILRRRNDRQHTLSKRIETLQGLKQHLVAPERDATA